MVRLCGPAIPVCGACQVMPGWHRDPVVRELLANPPFEMPPTEKLH
jgi:hypothetical protein